MTTDCKRTGSYYTPQEWAEELAELSLGRFLTELGERHAAHPKEHIAALQAIRVLDPSCGHGILLRAAAKLLLRAYASLGESQPNLSLNLYGVDISEEAVTKTREALAPIGGANICRGDALIDAPEISPLAFNWQANFGEIMENGGFDIIIANPPYIAPRGNKPSQQLREWLHERYPLCGSQLNHYGMFMEKIYRLLRHGGRAAILTPNTWLNISNFAALRRHLLTHSAELNITNIRGQIFKGAIVDVCLTGYRKGPPSTLHYIEQHKGNRTCSQCVPAKALCSGEYIISPTHTDSRFTQLIRDIQSASRPLSEFATISSGMKVYERGKGSPPQTDDIIRSRAFHHSGPPGPHDLPWLDGSDIKRYAITHRRGLYLRMGPHLAAPRHKVDFRAPRILVRQIPSPLPHCIHAAYTEAAAASDINCHVVHQFRSLHPLALLALINSPLMSLWFAISSGKLERSTFPQFKVRELADFPIPHGAVLYESELKTLACPEKEAELTALHLKLCNLPQDLFEQEHVKQLLSASKRH